VHHARQNNMTLIKACERNNRFRSLVSYSQLQAKPHSVKLVTQTCPTLGLAATTCCKSKAPVNAPLNSSGPGASALVCRAAPVPEQFPGQHAHRALLLSVDGKALQHFINDLYQPSTHFQYKIFEGIQRKGIDSKNIRDSFGKSNCKACGVYRHRYMCVFKLGSKYAWSN